MTMLGYLADHEMTQDWDEKPRVYDNPTQLDYIDLFDPSRWVGKPPARNRRQEESKFWKRFRACPNGRYLTLN